MNQVIDHKQLVTCNTILGEVYLSLQKLESELTRLSNDKKAIESELATIKEKLSERDKELELLRKQNRPYWVVASVKKSKFHRLTCDYATHILHSDNARIYENRDSAIEAGFKPCQTCCP
ncbi:MAG: Ada metal-binding domain-containing protein [Blastocatellia bacterium]